MMKRDDLEKPGMSRRPGLPRRVRRCVAAVLLLLPLGAAAQSLDDLTILTEHYPPYNFEEQGRLQGMAVDLMVAIFEKLGAKRGRESIKVRPWARGYQQLLRKRNTALFSTTRTEEREKLFKWVGPISPTTISLIAKKSSGVSIDSVSDIRRYRLGVVVDDVGEQLLLRAGLELGDLDRVSGSDVTSLSLQKLNGGRIDAWAYEQNVAMWVIAKAGLDTADYEVVHVLDESFLYFAFHKDTSDDLIARIQGTLDALKQDGTFEKILGKYTN